MFVIGAWNMDFFPTPFNKGVTLSTKSLAIILSVKILNASTKYHVNFCILSSFAEINENIPEFEPISIIILILGKFYKYSIATSSSFGWIWPLVQNFLAMLHLSGLVNKMLPILLVTLIINPSLTRILVIQLYLIEEKNF